MIIHPTHTKKDMIEIIEIFDFAEAIEDYHDLGKNDLSLSLSQIVDNASNINPDAEYYIIENIDQLKSFLTSPNQSRISIKDKNKMIDIAKDIIFYCKNGYLLSVSVFTSVDELRYIAEEISFYGNIPTISRALILLNKDKKINPKIDIVQSGKIKIKLRKRKEEKLKKQGGFKKTYGDVLVTFD